tara:strand:- start:24 stop:299 length:276 start_codon:yes stop_codon:yes gene_type:complete
VESIEIPGKTDTRFTFHNHEVLIQSSNLRGQVAAMLAFSMWVTNAYGYPARPSTTSVAGHGPGGVMSFKFFEKAGETVVPVLNQANVLMTE